MSFVLTQDKIKLNELISALSAGVSIVCCIVVLGLAGWVWSVPSARGYLDRISFRLLLWSLFFEIIYDINYIAVCAKGIQGKSDGPGCVAGIYLMMSTMGVVNYLCTFIAVNLMITIVFGFNPILLNLERWYVLSSLFIGFFIPIVPAALGHFGWDPIFRVCWIQADSPSTRMRYFVLDLVRRGSARAADAQYLWQLLSCAIATVAVVATLVTLFRQGRATTRALFGGDTLNLDLSEDTQQDSNDDCAVKSKKPGLIARVVRRRRASLEHERMFGHLEDRFIRISLKIATYPIALIVVNGIITIGDLYITSTGGVKTTVVYGLYCLYYFLYGGRGIFFVVLALLVDPCLQRGLSAVWEARREMRRQSEDLGTRDLELGPKAPSPSVVPGFHSPFVGHDGSSMARSQAPDLNRLSVSPRAMSAYLPSLIAPSQHKRETTEGGDDDDDDQADGGEMGFMQALFELDGPENAPGGPVHWQRYDSPDVGRGDRKLSSASRRISLARLFKRRQSRSTSTVDSGKPSDNDDPTPRTTVAPGTDPTPTPKSDPAIPLKQAMPAMPEVPAMPVTFAGVQQLPEGLDDHVHDFVHPDALEAAHAVERLEKEVRGRRGSAALIMRDGSSTSGGSGISGGGGGGSGGGGGGVMAKLARVDSLKRKLARVEETGLDGSGNVPAAAAGSGTRTPQRDRDRDHEPEGASASASRTTSVRSGSRRASMADSSSQLAPSSLPPSRYAHSHGRTYSRRGPSSSIVYGSGDLSAIRTPMLGDRRVRRDKALELAERLYEEIEAQL